MVVSAIPPPIRFGIVGAGSVCEVKSGPAFYKAAGSSLVAVMRRTGALAEDFAKRHGVPRFYDDLDALLKDPEVDAVYVATPPGSHKDLALRVCAAGKPCYVEKPMARTYKECAEMLEAFEAAKLPLYVGYYRRHLPKFCYVKSILDSGKIGQVTGVSLRLSQFRHKLKGEEPRADWRVNAKNAGGGLFMDLGSHQLDLLDHLVGPLENVSGSARRVQPTCRLPDPSYAVEDRVILTFETPGGALGSASWNFCSGIWEDRVDIVGTKGSISFACFNNDPVQVELSVSEDTGKQLREPVVTEHQAEQPPHVHQPLVEAMVQDLQAWPSSAVQKECYSTGEASARTALVMDSVLEEFYGGKGSRETSFWDTPEKWNKPTGVASEVAGDGRKMSETNGTT